MVFRGSGKSTFAKTLASAIGAVHLEADMWFTDACGNYNWFPEGAKQAHAWCQAECRAAIERGLPVIVSNTFVRLWELEPYLRITSNVTVLHVQGNHGNVHHVPAEVVERMRNNFEEYPKIE